MTLLDIRNQIIGELLEKKDSESIVKIEDLKKSIKIDPEFETEKDELVLAAIEDLEEAGLIKILKSKTFLILRQPFNTNGQEIHLSMDTCNEIANLINSYLDAREDEGGRADVLNLSEFDIVMLLNILGDILSTDTEDKKDK